MTPQLEPGWLDRVPAAPDWRPRVDAFFVSAVGQGLCAFLDERMAQGAHIYPPAPLRMLALTPLSEVRVVIVGQDPYHGPGQAEGLAFSVSPGVRVPPSLRNIYQELSRDFQCPLPTGGSLAGWAQQGVLLLNTCLTVEEGQSASHARRGWESLTTSLLVACRDAPGARVFMLWGANAQALSAHVDTTRHLVLTANHPSPLSARRGPTPFIGCGHFSKANHWLIGQNMPVVQWLAQSQKTMA